MALRGRPVYQYGHVATYASRTVVHESCAIRIDPAMPLDRAALIGCSVMTGVGAVHQHRGGARGREHGGLRRRRRRAQRGAGRRDRGRAPDHRGRHRSPPSSTTRARMGATHGDRRLGARTPSPPSAASPAAAPTTPSWRWAPRARSPRRWRRWRPGGTCVLIGVPETGATVPLDVAPDGDGRARDPRLAATAARARARTCRGW